MNFLKDLKVLFRAYGLFLFIFLLHRSIFWALFKNSGLDAKNSALIKSWWVGVRFDVRVITLYLLVGLLTFFVIRLVFKLVPLSLKKLSKFYLQFQIAYLALGLLFFTIVFWVDIGNYQYLEERLTSKIFALLSSPKIALGMVAQSYPVYIIIPALIIAICLFLFVTSRLIFSIRPEPSFFPLAFKYKWKDGLKFVGVFLVMALLVHSKFSQYPLRWSEAYFSKSHFTSQFALNPVQNIFDTYKFSKTNYTYESIESELRLVAEDLGIKDLDNKLLVRPQKINPIAKLQGVKNVVVIMMESLAAFKLGTYGAPLNTSPNFDSLADESLLFENFHVIQTGTAASIFCFITGIPDLNEEETASRNPLVVDQHTMINNFKNHEKFYFIGGDANWGNIRGVITNNIEDINLLEEKDFKTASKTDIWGVSDLELFRQANDKLKIQKKPFFAFIQTAGYHKPYTIPKITDGFKKKVITDKQIKDYGFVSSDEYNSLRFSDHALGRFVEMAKSSDYYKNTIFVVYADHGLRSYDQIQLSNFYKKHFFPVYHIPFLVHSAMLPENLKGAKDPTLGFQPDMLATIQSMLGVEGVNSSFGLDLRSIEAKNRQGIFLRGSGAYPVRFFDGERLIETNLNNDGGIKSFKTENFLRQLTAISDEKFLNLEEKITPLIEQKAKLGRAYLKAIKYKLKNNQKAKVQKVKGS